MCPRRRGSRRRRSGRRRRGVRVTGSFWSSLKSFVGNGVRAIGNAFMKDPAKYINGAKNIYNSLKGNTTNGLTRRRKGRTGSGPRRGVGRRLGRRKRTGGAFDSLGRSGGVYHVMPRRGR